MNNMERRIDPDLRKGRETDQKNEPEQRLDQEHQRMFESLPPGELFLKCAVPSMISMAVTSLYTVADGIFVGRFIGSGALAAINLVMPFIMMSFALSDMIAAGSSVQISIRLGEKKGDEANRIFSFCSLLIFAISCAMGAAGWLFAGPLVRLMGADETVTALAVEYMRVYAVFSPGIMIFFALDNYLRICGKVRYSMLMNVGISLLNIVLDALFIAVWGWGIGAAALASCISLMAGTVIGFAPFLSRRLPLKLVRGRISLRMTGNILANGSSEFFSNISGSALMVIMNTVLLRLGGAMAVAAFSIVMYIDSVVKSLLFGMADSLQPAISYNYGAGNRSRMFAIEKRLLLAGAVLSMTVLLGLLLSGQHMIALFLDGSDKSLIELSWRAMKLFSMSYLICWFGMIAGSFFTALNRPVCSLTVAFGQTLVFPLLSLMTLPAVLGLDGVWLTGLAAGCMSALLAAVFFVRVQKTACIRNI
ncbi:MATE family efflux transporter [Bacilliculturomica massiliensis]|uniref:MATE family efflux transporter n=1 Tax=Bacilliculturomica massiliensis TaxID=1917867 RepID=UPI001FEBBF22|nr:MATE family efflux transporter [Bacilliculturomica massiliensis]